MKEGSLSLVFDPREFCSYGGDFSAGITISTAISKPTTNSISSTGSTSSTGDESSGESGGSNWPAPQPVQFNVANAQDEFEINFGISVSLSILNFLVASLFWSQIMGLVMIYVAYQLQFSMGVLRLFALLFQWSSCISRAGFFFPRDKIVSCTRGGFL